MTSIQKKSVRWPVMIALTIGIFVWGFFFMNDERSLGTAVLMAMSPWLGYLLRSWTDAASITR